MKPPRPAALPHALDVEHAVRSHARPSDATVVTLVALAAALGWLFLFYPGLMSPDSAGQLVEARRGVLSDWHPPIIPVLWNLLEHVVTGPFGMLVLQTAFFWTGLALLARRLPAGVVAKVAFLLLVGFSPPLVTVAGAIWKDVLLAAAMVLAFGLAGGHRAFWLAALLATLARHNAILAVAGAVLLHFWAARGPSLAGLARAVLATVTLFAAAHGINAALAQQRNHTVQVTALFDLVGIAATTRALPDLPPCFVRNAPLDLERVLAGYDPRSTLRLVTTEAELHYCFDGEAVSQLVRTWRGAIMAHPAAYSAHRLAVAGHLLGIRDTPGSYAMTRAAYDAESFPELEPPPQQTPQQAWLERRVLALRPYGVFRPWIYAVLALGAGAIAARRRSWWPCCIALSGLAYAAGLLVVAPAEDYRYSLWMIVAGLIATVWVAIEAGGRASAART